MRLIYYYDSIFKMAQDMLMSVKHTGRVPEFNFEPFLSINAALGE